MTHVSIEEAKQTGYRAFWAGEPMTEYNPYDPHKAAFSWCEDGWWFANREAFATGAVDCMAGKPRKNPWEAHDDEPMGKAYREGYDWQAAKIRG